ncbi:MAG: M23 family metallopeptidase [Deltaproteobacteria bacterium]|nr:M23 family metallopeptidase [Deltaproteobacteria bacterium]
MSSKIVLPILIVAALVTAAVAYSPLLLGSGDDDPAEVIAPESEAPVPAPAVAEPEPEPAPAPEAALPPVEVDEHAAAAGSRPIPVDPAPAPEAAAQTAGSAGEPVGPRAFGGPIDRSLYQTFAGRLPRDLADPLTAVTGRLLVWWLDPARDLRAGDAIELLYLPGEPEPKILALRFKSGKAGQTFEAYAFRPDAEGPLRYFDRQGVEIEARLEGSPIDTYEQITSLLKDGRGHQGVDFKAPIGTPVKAPFDVTVSRINWSTRRNGNCLDLAGPDGVHVLFLHLDRMAEGLRPGQKVKQGEVVAYSGNTGRSTAPHLHYQLQKGKKIVDPFEHHRTRHDRLPEAQQAAFQRERERLFDQLSIGVGGKVASK